MAELLWGKVYFFDNYAGMLREEPGGRMVFQYDQHFLDSNLPQIAFTLPKQSEPFIYEDGLHPFFDNLVAEGWMENAQARLLGKRIWTRFELLLAFGRDCAGAVSIIDPQPHKFTKPLDKMDAAILHSAASLSGIQPKLALIQENNLFRPAKSNEVSTYIAKFASPTIPDLIENEYLTTLAIKALLPNEDIVDLHLGFVQGFDEKVLIIKRFDRTLGAHKIHFEEFAQLLGLPTKLKYEGAYKDMADFIAENGIFAEVFRLYRRILVGILTGNTDMHFKNFAMFHTPAGLRLTPFYDLISAAIYHPRFQSIALKIGNAADLAIGSLKSKHIIKLAHEFGLTEKHVKTIVSEISERLGVAKTTIINQNEGDEILKAKIIQQIEKRWNVIYNSIGN